MVAWVSINEEPRQRIEQYLEAIVLTAALGTIPLTYYQAQGHTGTYIAVADWVIWAIFAIEFAIMLAFVSDRRSYMRQNWLMVAVVIITFPLLPHLLNLARLIRLVRLIRIVRLLRLGLVTARAIGALRIIMGRREVVFVTSASLILILAGGAGLALVEPDLIDGGVPDGLWWAIVTATTVGYGDIAPETMMGRTLGVGLMLLGIGIVGTLAASIAAYFVSQDDSQSTAEIKDQLLEVRKHQQVIIANQKRIEEMLTRAGATRQDN